MGELLNKRRGGGEPHPPQAERKKDQSADQLHMVGVESSSFPSSPEGTSVVCPPTYQE